MLFDSLLQIGDPHIPKFSDTDRKTVLDYIGDKSGKYLGEDDFAVYVSGEDVTIARKQYAVSSEDLCEAQTAFMQSTCTLEEKIVNKEIFLDIVKQAQFPVVHIRTRGEEEQLEGRKDILGPNISSTPAELQDDTSKCK